MTLLERARTRKPVTWLTVIGVLLLPAMIGGVLIAALYDPTDRLDNMTAAIVNDDDPVTVDGQYTPLGRQLAAGLVEGSDDVDSNLGWVLSNDEDAADGLSDGTYQAVIRIPAGFSAAATSSAQALSGTDETAERATVEVTTAPDALVMDEAITAQVADAAASTMGDTLSEATLSNLLIGFTSMGDQLGDAADGAQQLAEGAGEAKDGAGELGDGASQVADGVGQLGDGISQLADGAGAASTGTQDLAGGASALADGVPGLVDGANGLSDGATGLVSGIDQLNAGVTGDEGLVSGATQLADGIDQLRTGVDGDGSAANPGLVPGAQELASGLKTGVDQIRGTDLVPDELDQAAAGAVDGSAAVSTGLQQLVDDCSAGAAPAYCAEIGDTLSQLNETAAGTTQATAGVRDGLGGIAEAPAQMADRLQGAVDGATTLSHGVSELSNGIAPLAKGAHQLAGGARQLGDNLPQLSSGAHQLAGGATQLADGSAQLGGGANALADGASGLADGVGQLATGAGTAAASVPQLQDGATQVADGVTELGDGVGELGDGASTLAGGLGEAVDSVPSYGDDEAEDLASVVANPVSTTSSGSTLFGAAAIPLLAVAVLWFGGLATFLALRAVTAHALTSRRSSVFLAAGGLLPAAGIGVVQGGLVAGIVQLAAGYDAGVWWGLLGVSMLTGVAFAAVHQALIAVFGGTGRWIAGLLGALAVAVGIVSTLPEALVAARGLLPTTPAFEAMLAVLNGGAPSAVVGLLVWMVLSFTATTIAVAARRSVRAKALLRPSLA